MAMNSEDLESTKESIKKLDEDIGVAEADNKTIKEQIDQIMENLPEFKTMQEAADELAVAKEKLRTALTSKAGYNNLVEKLSSRREDLKDYKYVMSGHIVDYYAQTRSHQIEIDEDNGDAREVIVNGKLSKGKKKFQTSIFNNFNVVEQAELVD